MKTRILRISIVVRGLLHILVGLGLAAIIFLLPRNWAIFLIGLATLLLLSGDLLRLRWRVLRSWLQSILHTFLRNYESKRLLGATYLFVACLFTAVVFNRDVAILAISFMAVGDAVAGIIGRRFGRIHLFSKNLEGTLAGLAGSIIAGFIWHYLGLGTSIPAIISGAVAASVIESLPLPIDDNVTMPIGAGVVMTLVGLLAR
jgi:glycerol-3-phosphate acyltransferase PlsY